MNLPLKIYYTLKEASALLNEQLKRSDIDESYFLQLGIKGAVRLGIYTNPDHKNSVAKNGTIYSNYFEFSDESKIAEYVMALSTCISALFTTGSILILNPSDIKEIYFDIHSGLSDAFFDNVYSLDAQEFCIPDEFQKDLYCFNYADKLDFSDYLEPVHYSIKHKSIHYLFVNEKKEMSLPCVEEEDDWTLGYWFNKEFNHADIKKNELFSDRGITIEDCLILGEDLDLLLSGKQRESIEPHPIKRKNQKNESETTYKMHPKRENSINKIIYALASKANLDLSNHITAYEKLNAHCSALDIELPNKDTCGNLFKAANEFKKSN